MKRVAFNQNVIAFLDGVVNAINANNPAAAEAMMERAIQRLSSLTKTPGADIGGQMAAPNLHGLKTRTPYKTPEGAFNISDSVTKFAMNLATFLKAHDAQKASAPQGTPTMVSKLADDYEFLGDLKDLVHKVVHASDQQLDDQTGKFGADVMTALRKVNDHLGKMAIAGHIKFASDGDTMEDSALDLGPETSIPEEPQDKPAPHEPPAGGAEGMMGSIDSLVQSIDSFLVNLPVTAFHDRDAEKAARARAKATELRDDVLIIRKQVSDTRAAINGDPGHTERFASLARSVALKFARNTGK